MFKNKLYIGLALLTLGLGAKAQDTSKNDELPGNWFSNNANIVWGDQTRYTPTKTSQLYLEYELMGRQGPFDFYGYVDLPKTFDVGTKSFPSMWDKEGSKLFADLQARLSINALGELGETPGPFKEYFLASTYIGDFGRSKYGNSSQVLWLGAGATVNTYSKLNFDINFYFRRNFTNYGSIHEHRWNGYKFKFNWNYPVASLFNGDGALTYIGFADYDFGLDKAPKDKPSEDISSNHSFVISNVLDISYKRFHCSGVLRYWHHGGEMTNNGIVPGWVEGGHLQTNGFGYYIVAGFRLNK